MTVRRRCQVAGTVQGVGFRPFVARLARAEKLAGFVRNDRGSVVIEAEGSDDAVARFARRLLAEAPKAARIETVTWREIDPRCEDEFHIRLSAETDERAPVLPPDLAVCPACSSECLTPGQRREGYGFGSCTECGPRFTIARAVPWDRRRTSMSTFSPCSDCVAEYEDQGDRRYHAQTIACPRCGPRARLRDARTGDELALGSEAVRKAAAALEAGRIVALKGLGGFVLLVRADDERAVGRLRARKRRPRQPMAVLVRDLDAAKTLAELGSAEREALASPAAPIVLCESRPETPLAPAVTHRTPRVGLMLPSSPLHALLARSIDAPLVATSGNLHEEPLCTDNEDALDRLGNIADAILDHDRDVVRPIDDSVIDIVGTRPRVLRMARGLAPRVVDLGVVTSEPLLATGGHLKAAPAVVVDDRAVLWPHVGDLESALAREAMTAALGDAETFLGVQATRIACDAHPDYATSLWAEADGRPTVLVQHHHAHVAACLAEWGHERGLGFAWDGVGYGDEGPVRLWGGEVLDVDPSGARRLHHWLPFPLVGGDRAARDGRRALAGMCAAAKVRLPELDRFRAVAHLAARTTSVGRMFDAVAALTRVCELSTFEGEAAMRLEAIARAGAEPYAVALDGRAIDWRPMLVAMIAERDRAERVASRFHATLIAAVEQVVAVHSPALVALTGGCFQNQLLLSGATDALEGRGVRVITPLSVPPGDGGLALGQAWVAIGRENCTMAPAHVSGDSR